MSEESLIVIKAVASIVVLLVALKIAEALVDMWAARAIGRLCDKYELPVEKRKELLTRPRNRMVGKD